jgi:hypothetical protein
MVNHERVYRLYRLEGLEGLTVRIKRRKRLAASGVAFSAPAGSFREELRRKRGAEEAELAATLDMRWSAQGTRRRAPSRPTHRGRERTGR